jgi:hypothetical protein
VGKPEARCADCGSRRRHGCSGPREKSPGASRIPHSRFIGRCEAPLGAASYAALCRQHSPKHPAQSQCRFGCHRSRNTRGIYDAAAMQGPGRLFLPGPEREPRRFSLERKFWQAWRRAWQFARMIEATTAIDKVARLVSLSSSRWCLGRGAKSREVVARGCKPGLCCVHSPGHHHQSALYCSASIGDYFCRTLRFCLNRVRADLLGNFVRKCRSVCPKHVSWPR